MSKPILRFKSDKYKKSRGGYSRLLEISCDHCSNSLFYYQKDGPGILKRLYLDRIYDLKLNQTHDLICPKCKESLGISAIYKKENRPIFRLFAGAIKKKIVKSKK